MLACIDEILTYEDRTMKNRISSGKTAFSDHKLMVVKEDLMVNGLPVGKLKKTYSVNTSLGVDTKGDLFDICLAMTEILLEHGHKTGEIRHKGIHFKTERELEDFVNLCQFRWCPTSYPEDHMEFLCIYVPCGWFSDIHPHTGFGCMYAISNEHTTPTRHKWGYDKSCPLLTQEYSNEMDDIAEMENRQQMEADYYANCT